MLCLQEDNLQECVGVPTHTMHAKYWSYLNLKTCLAFSSCLTHKYWFAETGQWPKCTNIQTVTVDALLFCLPTKSVSKIKYIIGALKKIKIKSKFTFFYKKTIKWIWPKLIKSWSTDVTFTLLTLIKFFKVNFHQLKVNITSCQERGLLHFTGHPYCLVWFLLCTVHDMNAFLKSCESVYLQETCRKN